MKTVLTYILCLLMIAGLPVFTTGCAKKAPDRESPVTDRAESPDEQPDTSEDDLSNLGDFPPPTNEVPQSSASARR